MKGASSLSFPIPAYGDHLLDNEILLKDVHLMANNVIIDEFPAFVANLESGLVRFEFSEDLLSDDSRQYLYNLKGGATKEIKLGININDTSINYGHSASFFVACGIILYTISLQAISILKFTVLVHIIITSEVLFHLQMRGSCSPLPN